MGGVVAVAVTCVVIAAAFGVPSVRAAATAFLDMFRVVNFAAVPMQSDALRKLSNSNLDLPHLLADQVQVLEKAAPPTSFATPAAAGASAGFHVYLPTWMPVGWDMQAPAVQVSGAGAVRVTASTARLQQILTSLDINDVSIPQGLDGQTATIHTSPAVVVRWQHGGQTLQLLQSPSPQVDFPAGTNLSALAEIGLRVLGLPREDAYNFAQSFDWRTTLLVPIPPNASSFRQVSVQGGSGLLIELTGRAVGEVMRPSALLLWSNGGKVFQLSGSLNPAELLEMAQTLQ